MFNILWWSGECGQSEFDCGNGVCVDPGRKCDGYDDCGNRADETGCGMLLICLNARFLYGKVCTIANNYLNEIYICQYHICHKCETIVQKIRASEIEKSLKQDGIL